MIFKIDLEIEKRLGKFQKHHKQALHLSPFYLQWPFKLMLEQALHLSQVLKFRYLSR